MEFTLTHPDTGIKEILVIFEGTPYEANSDHPWWNEIIRLCLADDPRVLDLFPIRAVQQPSEEIPFEEALSAYKRAIAAEPTIFGGQDPEEEDSFGYETWEDYEIAMESKEERDNVLRASYEWETLYTIAVGAVLDLRETVRKQELAMQQMQQEIDYLTSGLKCYAPHAWNNIKHDLESKGWL